MIDNENDYSFKLIPLQILLSSDVYPSGHSQAVTRERWTAVKQEDTFQYTVSIQHIFIIHSVYD